MSFDPFSWNYQNKRSDSINECLPTLGGKCTHLQFSQTRPPVAVLVNQRHQRFVNILVLVVVVRNSEVDPKLISRGRGKIPKKKKKKKKGKVSAHRLGGKKMAATECEKAPANLPRAPSAAGWPRSAGTAWGHRPGFRSAPRPGSSCGRPRSRAAAGRTPSAERVS